MTLTLGKTVAGAARWKKEEGKKWTGGDLINNFTSVIYNEMLQLYITSHCKLRS
jgi:hypothetical protein